MKDEAIGYRLLAIEIFEIPQHVPIVYSLQPIVYFDFCLLTFDLLLTQPLGSSAHNEYDLPKRH